MEDLARTSPYFLGQLIEVISLNTEIIQESTEALAGEEWGQ